MDNSNQPIEQNQQVTQTSVPWSLVFFIVLVIVTIGIAWQYTGNKPVEIQDKPPETILPEPEVIEKIAVVEIEIPAVVIEETVEVVENPLPSLDESDSWLKIKLPEITWRKELLSLVIDEDMIRRFVVFTDNFAQGIIAYEHSPFILPSTKFSPDLKNKPNQSTWQWNEQATQRFSAYVDLLRSMDSEGLVLWYMEIKPLIDEAYSELGYEENFTNTLQDAITRVLDMELPKSSMHLIRPSVMYKFSDAQLEALPQADKLLLRLGKDNLLVIKSFLLELHEKLAQQENGVANGTN